jgi:hypothetical protein
MTDDTAPRAGNMINSDRAAQTFGCQRASAAPERQYPVNEGFPADH